MSGMPCPVCKTNLTVAERQGVEIDHCPNCRGIWLDRGELDKILDRSAQAEGSSFQSERHQSERHHGDRHYGSQPPHKCKKSFLEELFD